MRVAAEIPSLSHPPALGKLDRKLTGTLDLTRAAHRDPAAGPAEFHRADARRQVRHFRCTAYRYPSRSTIRRTGRLLTPSMPVSSSAFPARPPHLS